MTDVDPKARIAGIFDRAAPTYDQTGVELFGPPGRELVRCAGITAGQRVLDLGCGRGNVLFPAAAAVGGTGAVVGVDFAPAMIAATTHAAKDLPWVRVTAGDADHPDFPPDSFDAVTAGFMVFLLPDPPAAVARWSRLLRPGGRLALSTFAAATEAGEAFYRDRTAALLPFQTPEPAREEQSSSSPEWVAALFAGTDLVDVTMTGLTVRSVYPTADAYWDWMLSLGSRRQLERVPAEHEQAARAALGKVLDQHLRQPDGSYRMDTDVRLTVARRPG
ncbi:MAG TPA: methyltransferase domain-containing protein [Asanoa sp.]|jgi:ubiquinone/menaquinone biosynthesis C-methylase UbiE|nr:methyltransferase domain-containing protein [Asanoa sp.]